MADDRPKSDDYVLEMEVDSPLRTAQVEVMKQMIVGGYPPGLDLTLDERGGGVPPMAMLLDDEGAGKIRVRKLSAEHLRRVIQTLLRSVDRSDLQEAHAPDELTIEAHIKVGAGIKAFIAANTEGGVKVTMTWKKK